MHLQTDCVIWLHMLFLPCSFNYYALLCVFIGKKYCSWSPSYKSIEYMRKKEDL